MALPTSVPRIQMNQFSPNSSPLNQPFFNAAFAGRLNPNPVYKEVYWCDIVGEAGISTFLDEYTGYDTFCFPNFSVIENNPYREQVQTELAATIPAYPGTVVVTIKTSTSQFYNAYILPQVGNTLVAPPYGALIEVVAVQPGGGSPGPTMTLRHRSTTGASLVIPAGTEMIVLIGKYMADCECPSGLLRVPDMPIIANLTMRDIGASTGEICGKALTACQNLKIPFYDAQGRESELWYNEPLKKMYRDFERMKTFHRLLDPDWGLVPVLIARGAVFTTASPSVITVEDVYAWGSEMINKGVTCKEFAIAAGRDLFVQFQKMMNLEGVQKVVWAVYDSSDDCKWLNLNWCGIKVGGLTLHVFEDPWMSTGWGLGAAGFRFKQAGIMIPLCNRATNFKDGESQTKMLTTTYFKDVQGRVWDNLQDGNGIWGPRNTFGAGCDSQIWTVKTSMTQTVHCPQAWGLINFLA